MEAKGSCAAIGPMHGTGCEGPLLGTQSDAFRVEGERMRPFITPQRWIGLRARTEVKATRELAVLPGSVLEGEAGGQMIGVERRRSGGWVSHLRSLAIAIGVALGLAVPLGLAPGACSAMANDVPGEGGVQLTPVGMRIDHVPIPVRGSDDRYHVVYELALTNFSIDKATVDRLDVFDAHQGGIVASLDAEELATRLVVPDTAAVPGSLG